MYSDAYIDLLEAGPMPNMVDLWAERARYFHQLHAQMIGIAIDELRHKLIRRGYTLGREMSLQIADGRQPDIHIQSQNGLDTNNGDWSYVLAAEEALAEVGVNVLDDNVLDALTIRDQSAQLVSVVEIISPANKKDDVQIMDYRQRRENIYLRQGVNVVEIDLTRSVKRLVVPPLTTQSAYHIAIFIPGDELRIIQLNAFEALKRIAIPLRREVEALDLHEVYAKAYRQLGIANQINYYQHYTEDNLPFPSLLSDEQRQQALSAVATWREQLQQLADA